MTNAIVIGFETDMPELRCWDAIENLFLVIFFVELGLRLYVTGVYGYFDHCGHDFGWNVFDFAVVAAGIYGGILEICGAESGAGGAATSLRVIRLLRILRIFRIVRFLRQLYMLAFGMVLAAMAILWVTVLMVFILYVCAIILVRAVGQMQDHADYEFLLTKFGNIPISMLTLFELTVNPYLEPYRSVLGQDWELTICIIGFVIFGSFGMIALLTGVIHESMFEKNMLKLEEEQQQRDAKRRVLLELCG